MEGGAVGEGGGDAEGEGGGADVGGYHHRVELQTPLRARVAHIMERYQHMREVGGGGSDGGWSEGEDGGDGGEGVGGGSSNIGVGRKDGAAAAATRTASSVYSKFSLCFRLTIVLT